MDKMKMSDKCDASIVRGTPKNGESMEIIGRYYVTCIGPDGELKWADHIDNLVTTVGKNKILDEALAGTTYTATWFIGLVDNAGFTGYAAGDTMASHTGWAESTAYTETVRQDLDGNMNAASGGAKTTTTDRSFSINASATLDGCFVCSDSTKGGTAGVLLSAGAFSTGDKTVGNGDTLNVSYTLTLT